MDHAATTPVDARVFEAMRPYFCDVFGNAASGTHAFGWDAAAAVEKARWRVAALLHADSREIVFTSGATESNNLALKGLAAAMREKGRHIVTQVTEHHAVIDVCKTLQKEGCAVTWLPVSRTGRVSAQQVAEAIRPDTVLVSVMWANNEIGTIQPIREIGQVCRERGVFFHTDATQAVGKLPVDVEADFVDLLSLSAHKLYGPKGCGALYVRRKNPRVRLTPLFDGGGHERGLRSGTANVPGIVGLGAACELAGREMPQESVRLAALRDRLEAGITSELENVSINGDTAHRLPHVTNLSFAFVESEALLMGLDGIAVSSGSACTSLSQESSFVLRALGIGPDTPAATIRFSLGRRTTEAEVDYVVQRVVSEVRRLRAISPLGETVVL